ncbi:unnamed protein product [Ectocarpus sp. CCAP 1310/34]|nr:unnamed protein product [Ectocarpus sp. CCAP 1310/34]
MMASDKLPAVGALSRQLQALSGSGWTNVQTPVRQGFEAVEATAHGLADQLAASRSELRRLEARLVGMEDMLSQRMDGHVRSTREEVDVLRSALDRVPRLGDVQGRRRTLESEVTKRTRELELSVAEVREESRKGVEAARQAATGKAGLPDLEAYCPRGEAATRTDVQDLENRLARKADREALDGDLATKVQGNAPVSWVDFERLLRDKADASALSELDANCATSAALERVEIGLARAAGMEEVRAFVEKQTGDIQAMSPALERLLAARAREEREAVERSPASPVTRGELPGLVRACLRGLRDGDGGGGGEDDGLFPSGISASQVQAAVSAGREVKRLRLELDESVGRVRARAEGIGKGLDQAKEELVSLLNAKAYKADVSLLLQGKADSGDLSRLAALVQTKVNESDHRESAARTAHSLTALSGEVCGLRGELRLDVERLSSRLLAKADSDDLTAVKKTVAGAAAAAVEAAKASAKATAAATIAAGGSTSDLTPSMLSPPPANLGNASSLLRSRNGDLNGDRNGDRNGDGDAGGDGRERGAAAPPSRGGGGLSREETRLLIRAELKRAGISDKITREEASVLAEDCAARALASATTTTDGLDRRISNINHRLQRSTVAVSQPHVERLFAAQSNLELRVARSLSLGRWLWRGVNFSAAYAAAAAAAAAAAPGNSAGIDGGGVTGDGGGFTSAGILLCGGSRVDGAGGGGGGGGGIWVPWEAEAANASPERLKVGPTHDRFRTCQSKYAEECEWTPGCASVTAVVPGLYLLSCGFFSQIPFVATVFHPYLLHVTPHNTTRTFVDCSRSAPHSVHLGPVPTPFLHRFCAQIYLNGDPVYSFSSRRREPLVSASGENDAHKPVSAAARPSADSKEACGDPTRCRSKHPAGEVLASSAREYLACPAGGVVSVKFEILVGEISGGRPSSGVLGGHGRLVGDRIVAAGIGEAPKEGPHGSYSGKSGEPAEGGCREDFPRPQGFLEIQKL